MSDLKHLGESTWQGDSAEVFPVSHLQCGLVSGAVEGHGQALPGHLGPRALTPTGEGHVDAGEVPVEGEPPRRLVQA